MRNQGFLLAVLLSLALPAFAADADWPQWRGPTATGESTSATPAKTWSETNNIRWKVPTPGFGTSTPIISGNRVFLLTAIPTGKKTEAKTPPAAPGGPGGRGAEPAPSELYQFVVLCLDQATGKTLWQKVAREQVPHEGHHQDHGFASASPVTDGKHLYAYFGSRGLYCYDFEGNLKWEKDFGDMQTRMGFGEGSSPALHGDTIVVLWDHEGPDDFLVALDKTTGKEKWRTPRAEATGWCTPLIVEVDGKPQVIINGAAKVKGYDLKTGAEIWEHAGTTVNPIPTPVSDGKMLYVMAGFRGNALYAIKLSGAKGDLTDTAAVVWKHNKSTPYVPSPLLTDGLLYFVSNNNGILSCYEAATGKPLIDAERLEDCRGIYASPVATKDRVYVLGREGKCLVLKKGPKLEVLAINALDDRTDSSIALAGSDLFIRGHKALYCIGEKSK